jgi:hypothetical protein
MSSTCYQDIYVVSQLTEDGLRAAWKRPLLFIRGDTSDPYPQVLDGGPRGDGAPLGPISRAISGPMPGFAAAGPGDLRH